MMKVLEQLAADADTQLQKIYKDEISFLDYNSPYQLLISVILSARTTDKQVNKITPFLFQKYRLPADLKNAELSEVEDIIRSTGFYSVKAKHIIGTASLLNNEFNDIVPSSFKDLLKFPGIGRKSASVIRGHIFDLPAIIVDTHFGRVANRLGLSDSKNPDRIENDLSALLDEDLHMGFSMKVNKFGRDVCHSRNPECEICPLNDLCAYYKRLFKPEDQ